MWKILVMFLSAAVLTIALPARADLTWTDTRNIDQVLDNAALTALPQMVGWTHTAAPPSLVTAAGGLYELAGATLWVWAESIGPEELAGVVYRDLAGEYHVLGELGPLTDSDIAAGRTMTESRFELDPAWLGGGEYSAYVGGIRLVHPDGLCRIDKALLAATYAPAPAPAALWMATVGLGVVGYLKRRAGR